MSMFIENATIGLPSAEVAVFKIINCLRLKFRYLTF